MKAKFTATIISSAMLLTACPEQEQPSAAQTEQTECGYYKHEPDHETEDDKLRDIMYATAGSF